MKKLLVLLIMGMFVSTAMLAQSNKVASAYQYLKDEQPEKAKVEIDAACEHASTKDEAKTWFYRGNIYLQLHLVAHMDDNLVKGMTAREVKGILSEPTSSKNYKKLESGQKWIYPYELVILFKNDSIVESWDYPMGPTYKALDDGNLLQTAYDSYVQTLKLDPSYTRQELGISNPKQGITSIGVFYFNDGITALQKEEYQLGLDKLEKAYSIYKEVGKKEDRIPLYAGYCAQSLKNNEKAIKYYEIAVRKKMKNASLYMGLSDIYIEEGNNERALEVIKIGREVLPDNQNILLAEANIYMGSNRATEANELLRKAAEKDPNNAQLQFAIGANYDKILKDTLSTPEAKANAFKESEVCYSNALELDPKYFNAAYNLGALYYNTGADKLKEAGNLPMSEQKKYDALKAEAKDLFTKAVKPLEACHTIDPTERNTMVMLRTAYMQVGDLENMKKIKAELDKK